MYYNIGERRPTIKYFPLVIIQSKEIGYLRGIMYHKYNIVSLNFLWFSGFKLQCETVDIRINVRNISILFSFGNNIYFELHNLKL